jgi:hypothetical protein
MFRCKGRAFSKKVHEKNCSKIAHFRSGGFQEPITDQDEKKKGLD